MTEPVLEGKFDGIDTMPLFDMRPVPLPEPEPKVSPDRRRTIRQAEAIAAGRHPLSLVFPRVVRHPDTRGQTYARDDPKGRDLTCGSCAWRERDEYHGRVYLKCSIDGDRRVSNGAATDLRSWWPGCDRWEAR